MNFTFDKAIFYTIVLMGFHCHVTPGTKRVYEGMLNQYVKKCNVLSSLMLSTSQKRHSLTSIMSIRL